MTTLHVNIGKKIHGIICNIKPISADPLAHSKMHMFNDKDVVSMLIIQKLPDRFDKYNYEYHLVVERESQTDFKFIIVPHQLWIYLRKLIRDIKIEVIKLHIIEDNSTRFTCTSGKYDDEDIRSVEIPVQEFCKSVPLSTIITGEVLDTPQDPPLVSSYSISIGGTPAQEELVQIFVKFVYREIMRLCHKESYPPLNP